jgi:hypothetical protein
MIINRTAECLKNVSDREVLVMLVTTNGEDTARNIWQWRKIM